ncbi:positive transcriptional regulator, MutR family [Streptococcus troglodytae]|uniref:Positive transcriptional regulator, MutR family n=1 Tax=Streptococcus troglodytae TaxID=1111760 RepID=A0A1L7LME6_9STRE|nr:positive transcriptional regulator, MutR family [Streptococcus troglodytae]
MILIERREFYHAIYFIKHLEKLLIYQDMFIIVSLNFLKQIIAYLQGEITEKSKLERYIEMVEELGNPTTAMFLRTNLEQLLLESNSKN